MKNDNHELIRTITRSVAFLVPLIAGCVGMFLLSDVRDIHDVVLVGIESPIFVPRSGMRGRATTLESRAPVHMACWSILQQTPETVATTSARKALGLKGNASKEEVPEAVFALVDGAKERKDIFPPHKAPDVYDAAAIAVFLIEKALALLDDD